MRLRSRTNSFHIVKELANTGALQNLRLGLNLRIENFMPVLEIDYVYWIYTKSIFDKGEFKTNDPLLIDALNTHPRNQANKK